MADYQPKLTVVLQELDDESYLGEVLFFPEVSCFGSEPGRMAAALAIDARRLIGETPPAILHRRHGGGEPEVGAVEVVLDPPARSVRWVEPVRLTFQTLTWQQSPDAFVAFVPALGIEVLANRPDELAERVPEHIRFALMRTGAAASLAELVRCARFGAVEVRPAVVEVALPTPKQAAMEALRGRQDAKSVLRETADDMTPANHPPAYEIEPLVALLAEALSGRSAKSVLLVGPSGVGKTAAVQELVRRRVGLGLGGTGFWSTSGGRLVAGMSGFGMWQERCLQLCREASSRHAVLYVGNLIELMQVGKSLHNPQGIAAFLRPFLARGELTVIAEGTPEQLPLIEREDPHLLTAFHQMTVEEPGPEKTRAILRARASAASEALKPKRVIDDEALAELDRLHRRYATYSANPGRPLRFLEILLADRQDAVSLPSWLREKFKVGPAADAAVGPAAVIAAFARETGLPAFLLDPAVPLDLAAARGFFAERVIGQPEAADLVVDLLATVKAGLSRPRKPIAGLMFIGPTGVGKTEMAKCLAEFLFGDKNRLTRFDMSEYADEAAVGRLIGGQFGAEGLLTAKVREQPFSVVLLDEFEKAHPSFLDLLLQVFGEGRLTDAGGRPADFSNSVVILTSNLGAESFQHGPGGFVRAGTRADARGHFVEEVRSAVRPELFNRIDCVVPFAPLDAATVAGIARRELELIRKRDGLRFRAADLHVPEDVVAHLAAKGYDPRYGARPLKRAVERRLIAPMAAGMIGFAEDTALTVSVSLAGAELNVEVRARADDAGRTSAAPGAGGLGGFARECQKLRRQVQRLQNGAAALELANEIFACERLERRMLVRNRQDPRELARLGKLAKLRKIAAALNGLANRAREMEDRVLLALYESRGFVGGEEPPRPAELADEWERLLLTMLCRRYPRPDDVVLALFSDDRASLYDLARDYAGVAAAAGLRVAVGAFTPGRQGRAAGATVYAVRPGGLKVFVDGAAADDEAVVGFAERACTPLQKELADPDRFLSAPGEGVVGLMLALSGPAAHPRFEHEHGLHVFVADRNQNRVVAAVFDGNWEDYVPPAGIERRGGFAGAVERRRTYLHDTRELTDPQLGKTLVWTSDAVGEAIRQRLAIEALTLIED